MLVDLLHDCLRSRTSGEDWFDFLLMVFSYLGKEPH